MESAKPDVTLLERLPEPVLLVSPSGETLYGNRAFLRLAAQYHVPARLSALFGPPAQVVIGEARRTGRASAFLPLIVASDVSQGFRLNVDADSDDGTLAVQMSDLSAEVEWRHELFMRNSELAVLNDVGAAMSATLELDALARRIWEQTGRIMENANFYLALVEPDPGLLNCVLWVEGGEVSPEMPTRPLTNGLTEHILSTRKPLLLNGDIAEQLEQLGLERIGRPMASFLGAPLLFDGQALGVIGLIDYEKQGRYGRHDLNIIGIVATQAAAAVRNARLFQTTRVAYEELTATQEKLLENERLRGVTETVGALNHEVNNPLATIVGTAQLLLRRDDLEPAFRERVERVLNAAKRIQFVTTKMANLIQATSRPYPGQTSILDVRESLSRQLEELAPGAGAIARRGDAGGDPPAAAPESSAA